MTVKWIVTATEAGASVNRVDGTSPEPQEVLCIECQRMPSRADSRARRRILARDVVDVLRRGLMAGEYDAIVIVAPASLLDDIHAQMDTNISRLVEREELREVSSHRPLRWLQRAH